MAEGSETKIYDLDHVGVVFNQNVVQLYVSMSNPLGVQVVEGFNNLLKKPPAGWLLDLPVGTLLLYKLVQANTSNIISHDTYFSVSLNQVVHLNYVGVVDFPEGDDLPLHSFSLHAVVQFSFLVYFNRILLRGGLMVADVHASVCSLAYELSNLVVFKFAVRLLGFLMSAVNRIAINAHGSNVTASL